MISLLLLIPIIQAQIVTEHSVDLIKSRVVTVPLPAPPTTDVIHHFSFILPPAPSGKMTQLTANITASDSLSYSVWDMYALSTSMTADSQWKSISFYDGFHMRDMKGTPDDGYLWSTPNGGYKPATGYNTNTNVGLKCTSRFDIVNVNKYSMAIISDSKLRPKNGSLKPSAVNVTFVYHEVTVVEITKEKLSYGLSMYSDGPDNTLSLDTVYVVPYTLLQDLKTNMNAGQLQFSLKCSQDRQDCNYYSSSSYYSKTLGMYLAVSSGFAPLDPTPFALSDDRFYKGYNPKANVDDISFYYLDGSYSDNIFYFASSKYEFCSVDESEDDNQSIYMTPIRYPNSQANVLTTLIYFRPDSPNCMQETEIPNPAFLIIALIIALAGVTIFYCCFRYRPNKAFTGSVPDDMPADRKLVYSELYRIRKYVKYLLIAQFVLSFPLFFAFDWFWTALASWVAGTLWWLSFFSYQPLLIMMWGVVSIIGGLFFAIMIFIISLSQQPWCTGMHHLWAALFGINCILCCVTAYFVFSLYNGINKVLVTITLGNAGAIMPGVQMIPAQAMGQVVVAQGMPSGFYYPNAPPFTVSAQPGQVGVGGMQPAPMMGGMVMAPPGYVAVQGGGAYGGPQYAVSPFPTPSSASAPAPSSGMGNAATVTVVKGV